MSNEHCNTIITQKWVISNVESVKHAHKWNALLSHINKFMLQTHSNYTVFAVVISCNALCVKWLLGSEICCHFRRSRFSLCAYFFDRFSSGFRIKKKNETHWEKVWFYCVVFFSLNHHIYINLAEKRCPTWLSEQKKQRCGSFQLWKKIITTVLRKES